MREGSNVAANDAAMRERNDEHQSLDEASEYRKGSGISFARSSNILSSVNKYGMPTVLPSHQKPPEDEDPLDAFMREIEGQAIQDKQVTLQHQKELEEKAWKKLLKEKQLLEKLQGKTDQKESIVETIDNTSAMKVKQVEQFQSKNFKYDEDSEEETQKYLKRSHLGRGHQKHKDSEKDEVMSDGIDDSEQALLDRQEALLDGNGNLDYEKLRQMEKKGIQALNTLDHTQIEYDSFEKNFYQEHPDITAMSFEDVNYTRRQLQVRVQGERVPKPITEFKHLLVDQWILDRIKKMNYVEPTPIQAQSLPCSLSGRDIIGIAKTGSGKTLAFLIPMLVHILDQRPLEKNEGPIGLVMAPTRELCQQIYNEYRKYCKPYNVNVLPIFGGVQQHQLWKDIKAGKNEIVIATPGRLIDMIRKKAFNLSSRCTFLVIDEADQIQTLFFSATFKNKVQELCSDILTDPIKIVVGREGVSNEDVSQTVLILKKDIYKFQWLIESLDNFLGKGGQVLIFANQIQTVEGLEKDLAPVFKNKGLACLHGDKTQFDRTHIIDKVRKGEVNILISTNVASRGLDIPTIKTVINYDCAKDKEDHIHRIGRTGRAGDKEGVAYTLITKNETGKAAMLVKILENSNQVVSEELEQLAMSDGGFRKSRVTIGVKNFNMKINIAKEQKEMKKNARKIGDRTGIGFSKSDKKNGGNSDEDGNGNKMSAQQKKRMDKAQEEEMINQKIAREAELYFNRGGLGGGTFGSTENQGDVFDNMDQFSDRLKDQMKAKFSQNFISSGKVQTTSKEATVTFIKKSVTGDGQQIAQVEKEVLKLDEYQPKILESQSSSFYQAIPPQSNLGVKFSEEPQNFVNKSNFSLDKLYEDIKNRANNSAQTKPDQINRLSQNMCKLSKNSRNRSSSSSRNKDERKHKQRQRSFSSSSSRSKSRDKRDRKSSNRHPHQSSRSRRSRTRSRDRKSRDSKSHRRSRSSSHHRHRDRKSYHDRDRKNGNSRSDSRDKYRKQRSKSRSVNREPQQAKPKRISKWDIKPDTV
eukprot:403339941